MSAFDQMVDLACQDPDLRMIYCKSTTANYLDPEVGDVFATWNYARQTFANGYEPFDDDHKRLLLMGRVGVIRIIDGPETNPYPATALFVKVYDLRKLTMRLGEMMSERKSPSEICSHIDS